MDSSSLSVIFGQRLKELRENRGLYQEDVGEWFKMKKSTVSQWESGRLPHATIIAELAQKFNCTTDYLLGQTDNPNGVAKQSQQDQLEKDWPEVSRTLHSVLFRLGRKPTEAERRRAARILEVSFVDDEDDDKK